jgi:metal-responsive CopG/Arc/MetJ family transcriptional regulator
MGTNVKKIGISLPKQLFEQLEMARGAISRSRFISDAISAYLERRDRK